MQRLQETIYGLSLTTEFDAREKTDESRSEGYATGEIRKGIQRSGRSFMCRRHSHQKDDEGESNKEKVMLDYWIYGQEDRILKSGRGRCWPNGREIRNNMKARAADAHLYETESTKVHLLGKGSIKDATVAKRLQSTTETSYGGVVTSRGTISANQMASGRVYKNKKIAKMVESNAFRTGEFAKSVSKKARQSISLTFKAARRIAESAKAMTTALAAGGGVTIIIVMTFIFFGAAFYFFGDESSSNYIPVSAEVEAYTQVISRYANEDGIGEYVDLIKAVMMQESGGRGTDPMQCSESPYNTKYSKAPGSIKDPEYSINCGVHYLADCLKSAGVKNPLDMDRIRLALQGYNYGNGYIAWAIRRDGGYTVENASAFSDEQAKKHGWDGYGDKQYVAHVLRYYPYDSYNIGVGNGVIVQVAAQQIGNVGGKKFWSWYGFSGRVEWCACYVSWCADQCGYLKSGTIPKFAAVGDGVDWFKSRGQFQTRSYRPAPGDIIFFDCGADGTRDHVGIVEKCDGRTVYNIEGNSGDACKRRSYVVGSSCIYGYGVPKY